MQNHRAAFLSGNAAFETPRNYHKSPSRRFTQREGCRGRHPLHNINHRPDFCKASESRVRTCPHRDSCTSFRQILPMTALKILEMRQHSCGFSPCPQAKLCSKICTFTLCGQVLRVPQRVSELASEA